jgi:predicted RNase H-like nuclease
VTETVVGVDWHRRGWIALILERDRPPQALVAKDLSAVLEAVPTATCVAVDMPIGLPNTERKADALARAFVGPRWQSVFATPPAAVLKADSYVDANAIAQQIIGKGISQQAWALRHNIKRVAEVVEQDARVFEVHPEVSFRKLVGKPLLFSKTSWNGQMLRREALARDGIELPDELGEVGAVPPADVLDAAVAAWTARRYARAEAESLPPGAQPGQREVIWY